MTNAIVEHDAQKLLDQVKRETRARNILNNRTSVLPSLLVSCFGVGICQYFIFRSGFDAPMVVQLFLTLGFVGSLSGALEGIVVRRRLEAAIELLRLQEERNKKTDA